MKTVLDCNVVISAGLTDGACRKVLKKVLDQHNNFISDPILLEYKEVINRKKFYNVKNQLFSILEIVCELSEWIQPQNYNITSPDNDDLIYLNTAIAAEADFLITGNIRDFPKKQYHETTVITPAEFFHIDNHKHSNF